MNKYSEQLKNEVVSYATDFGVKKASETHNISRKTIENWMRKHKQDGGFTRSYTRPEKSPLELENERLTKEVMSLKRTVEILKEATAFFAASQKK